MAQGTASYELTITMDSELHRQITDAATTEGVSMSAWMASAIRHALDVHGERAAAGDFERRPEPVGDGEHEPRRGGGLTAAELAAARRRVSSRAEPQE